MILHHITLSTGDIATHRLDTIDAGAVALCRALLPAGGVISPLPAFRVEIHGPVFTIFRGREPLVTCGVGRCVDDPVWPSLASLQSQFAPVLAQPVAGDWLAVVILPSLAATTQADIGWLGDFERCMAAAILLPYE